MKKLILFLLVTYLTLAYITPEISNIQGKYQVTSIPGVRLVRPITMTLQATQIRLKGCNQLWSSYSYDGRTGRWSVQEFGSTLIGCQNDQDSLATNALKKAVKVTRRNNLLVFEDSRGYQTITFRVSGSSGGTDPVPIPTPIPDPKPNGSPITQGTYQVLRIFNKRVIGQVTLTIQKNSVRFQGCNSVAGSFSYNKNTLRWRARDLVTLTKRGCQNSQDDDIIRALERAAFAYLKGQQIIFEDRQSTQTLRAKRTRVIVPPGSSNIQGRYQVTWASGKSVSTVVLTIQDKSIGFRGCNSGGADYTYNPQTQSWKAGNFIQTLIACQFDQDGLVVQALTKAVRAYRSGANIIFVSSNGAQLLRGREISPVIDYNGSSDIGTGSPN